MDSASTKSTIPDTNQLSSLGRPTRLGIAGPPGTDIDSLVHQLRQAGLQRSLEVAKGGQTGYDSVKFVAPTELSAWLDEHGGAHVLLFWQAPVPVLSEAMSGNRALERALSAWVEQNEAILTVVRQNRRRFTLVEMTLAEANPAELVNRLNQRLSLSLSPPASAARKAPTQDDPIHSLIANRAVTGNARARRLVAELQATSIPVGLEEDLLPKAQATWQAYREALQKYQREIDQISSRYQKLESELEASTKSERNLESANRELEKENDLLLRQLHHVQEELEAYYLKSMGSQQESLSQLKRRNELLQRRVRYIETSRSWKITRPMRRLLKRLKGKSKNVNQNG